ncbi:uncharacterized protein FIBRA_00937 [Fibroporia radiculosa]|uniref:Adenosine deaminase domain-containing protein n=1 Tax=Fibroporia radiculosa TaxID=599839 RepID=J4GIZ4_9APHY|nr:uncharacterized protein FIBRA_00937 [Fibroporia radiculosa]CCL98930.1 predicted protein [Fibroporia radiculosa]
MTPGLESHVIAGHAADALASLTASQVAFLKSVPKAELHAHLNGSIPLPTLQELAHQYILEHDPQTDGHSPELDTLRASVEGLLQGVELNEIHEFFGLFPAIYTLTSTPAALATAARAVLQYFLSSDDGYPSAAYLELRTTPRESSSMNRLQYLESVLGEIEQYPEDKAALIVSLDRRMSADVAAECINCAIQLKRSGRRIVGVDLCGDPKAGNMEEFAVHFRRAKEAGLGITLHIAEIEESPASEILQLLSFQPDRLGHATFLDSNAKDIVKRNKSCIEICLSSNLLCKTVQTLDVHHIRYYLEHDHPIAICVECLPYFISTGLSYSINLQTDDILPFRNSLLAEYAMLMAAPPLGLGLTEEEIEEIAKMGMECRFRLGARMHK